MCPWESSPSTNSCLCAAQIGIAHGVHEGTPHPRASASIPRAARVGIAHGSMGQRPIHERPHEYPVRCAGWNCSWVHGGAPHPRACTSILCAAQVEIAHEPIGASPPFKSVHKHPARCAGGNRSWVHGKAPHPRVSASKWGSLAGPGEGGPSASTLCAAQVIERSCVHGWTPRPRASTGILRAARTGIAHGPVGEHPRPRASCALRR